MRRTCMLSVPAGVLLLALAAQGRAGEPSASAERSSFFRAPRRPAVPAVRRRDWGVNPLDAFVLARLESAGLAPSAPADRLRLLRRVTFDLWGLPPTVAEQEAFLADTSPDAYRKVVDRLLASPHFGERWAQHWLDLVRYAESDGFKADDLRPSAHRYRDYVIRAFNDDRPYDRFVRQQVAGDELEPDNPDALVATGFLRLWPDEYNAANLQQRRQEILDDITDVTGQVFLGLTFGCARCHDHKYDPITQNDYFRLQAFFALLRPRDDLPAVSPAERRAYEDRLKAWREATREARAEIDRLLAEPRRERRQFALTKFAPEIQQAVLTPDERRTPYQRQIAFLAEKQLSAAEATAPSRLKGEAKQRYQELERQLTAGRPEPPPPAMAVRDVGLDAPPTHRLAGGDWRKPRESLAPGFPAFLGDTAAHVVPLAERQSTGRRAALARWLTRPDNPLTARVVVNRLWQHHFGVGLVGTPSDFGSMGDGATHPELLDWLAVELVEHGWSLKHLHRLMVLSATYRQDSCVRPDEAAHRRALAADRNNRLLWHARRRRQEGESLRDAMLALSGELNPRLFGPSARPKLPAHISKYAWQPDARAEDRNRRSVYVLARRNMRYPLFDAFDQPDMHNSCARRLTTTTAPQALLLLNGELAREAADSLADTLSGRFGTDEEAALRYAYRLVWGRPPSDDEMRLGLAFVARQTERVLARQAAGGEEGDETAARLAALADFCHALLNTNEFLFVD